MELIKIIIGAGSQERLERLVCIGKDRTPNKYEKKNKIGKE
jgi:hypothetical protein